MIYADFEGRTIAIKFTHNMRPKGVKEEERPEDYKRTTVCEIITLPQGKRVSDGVGRNLTKGGTKVYKKDTYDRAFGRTEAFKRAVEKLPRDVRKTLWEAYEKSCKAKHKQK